MPLYSQKEAQEILEDSWFDLASQIEICWYSDERCWTARFWINMRDEYAKECLFEVTGEASPFDAAKTLYDRILGDDAILRRLDED